jgi:hypothetical protein
VAEQAVAGSGATAKKLDMAAAIMPICVNQPRMGSWNPLATMLEAMRTMQRGRVMEASCGLAAKARVVSR